MDLARRTTRNPLWMEPKQLRASDVPLYPRRSTNLVEENVYEAFPNLENVEAFLEVLWSRQQGFSSGNSVRRRKLDQTHCLAIGH